MKMKKNLLLAALGLLAAVSASAQTFSWARKYGGEGEDVVRSLAVDDDGNSYLTGYFTDTASFGNVTLTSNGWYDVFVTKTDTNGNLIWAKGFGSASFDYGTAVYTDHSGNVYISGVFEESFDADPGTGVTTLTSAGQQDIFVIKLKADGDFVWAKSMGGAGYEETTALGTDLEGNLYITGYFYDTVNFNPGGEVAELSPMGSCDGFIVKFDTNGGFTWAQRFGGSDIDLPMAMNVQDNGDMYITGQFREMADFNPNPVEAFFLFTESNGRSVFLMHLNNDGYLQEALNLGESQGDVIGRDIAIDADGNAYIAGSYSGELVLNGGTDNEISFNSGGFTKGFALKANVVDGVAWAKPFVSQEPNFGFGVAVNAAGQTFVSGFFAESITFGDTVLTQETENADENFIAALDANGNFTSAVQFGGANFLDSHHLRSDASGNLYTSGAMETLVDLNPVPGQDFPMESLGYRDTYLLKLKMPVLGTNDPAFVQDVFLYPNPASGFTYVHAAQNLSGMPYEVYDVSGRKIESGNVLADNAISLQNLPSGVYTLAVKGLHIFRIINQ